MERPINKIQYLLVFVLIFGFSYFSHAGSKQKKHLTISIKDAMNRSNTDQTRIKDQMDNEADQRVKSWKARQMDAIEIKHTGTSSVEPVNLGDPDFSTEDLGEDSSGLNRLRSDVEEEPTDINFDEELREVSSMKD